MKSSTKMLLTLLAIVIVALFAVNIILKNRIDKNLNNSIQAASSTNTLLPDTANNH